MQYNDLVVSSDAKMISYYIPLERYPETYNGQPLALASVPGG